MKNKNNISLLLSPNTNNKMTSQEITLNCLNFSANILKKISLDVFNGLPKDKQLFVAMKIYGKPITPLLLSWFVNLPRNRVIHFLESLKKQNLVIELDCGWVVVTSEIFKKISLRREIIKLVESHYGLITSQFLAHLEGLSIPQLKSELTLLKNNGYNHYRSRFSRVDPSSKSSRKIPIKK